MTLRAICVGLSLALTLVGCGDDGGTNPTSTGTGSGTDTGTDYEVCVPGIAYPCYTGPAGTQGVGICKPGVQVCNDAGDGYGACEGEVLPGVETCLTPEDDDCDGPYNEEGEGCECLPQSSESCYTGPAGTEDVGICDDGVRTCDEQGTGWSACEGETTPTTEDCASPADENCMGPASDGCSGDVDWSLVAGDAEDDEATAVAVDPATGAIVVVGSFVGQIDFGGGALTSAGATDVFVARFDSAGTLDWVRQYGDAGAQAATDVAIDPSGNVLVTGTMAGTVDFGGVPLATTGLSDVFVLKLDSAGAHLQSANFGDVSAQVGGAIASDPSGNVLLTGAVFGAIDFGGGPLVGAGEDVYVAKLDPSLGHLFSASYGDGESQVGVDIASDAAGSMFVAVELGGTANFGGANLTSAGDVDVALVKLTSAGGHLWSKSFGDAAEDRVTSLAVDGLSAVSIAGHFAGTLDIDGDGYVSAGLTDGFVARFDGNGNLQFSDTFGDLSADRGGVSVDGADQLVLGASFEGALDLGGGVATSAGGEDIFAARFAGDGTHQLSRRFGGLEDQRVNDVAGGPNGEIVLVGTTTGDVDFGGGPITSAGVDVFVLRLEP